MTQDGTGKLIECSEKNAEEDVEAPETASTTDGPGWGRGRELNKYGPGTMKRHCEHDDDAGRD